MFLAVVLILLTQWVENGVGKMFEHSQLVEVTWPWAYQALCFSCGYFAYDQWDMLLHRLYSGCIPSILVHHLVLLVCFTLALYRKVTINYLILTLICEVCFCKYPYRSNPNPVHGNGGQVTHFHCSANGGTITQNVYLQTCFQDLFLVFFQHYGLYLCHSLLERRRKISV